MADTTGENPVQARCIGDTTIIYASDYLNKLSGERIERILFFLSHTFSNTLIGVA